MHTYRFELFFSCYFKSITKNIYLILFCLCCFRSIIQIRFWPRNLYTHFENHSLLLNQFSCIKKPTWSFDILIVSAFSCNFSSRFASTILYTILWFLLATRAWCFIFVCSDTFNVNKPLLYHLSRLSRVQITLHLSQVYFIIIYLLKFVFGEICFHEIFFC